MVNLHGVHMGLNARSVVFARCFYRLSQVHIRFMEGLHVRKVMVES